MKNRLGFTPSRSIIALSALLALAACNNDEQSKNSITPQDRNPSLFFDYGSQWSYLDQGLAISNEWNQVGFDDSDWKNGQGIFFYGYDHAVEGNTILADYKAMGFVDATPSAYYFRKKVNVADISTLGDVYLNMKMDDAAAIYVNGQEIARSPLLPKYEVLTHTTSPLRYSKYGEDAEHTFILPSESFSQGENVIAVALFNQVNHRTNDVQFNVALNATFDYTGEPDGPYVTIGDTGEVTIDGINRNGLYSDTYTNISEAQVTVELPDELGSFSVELQNSYTPPEFQYEKPEQFFVTSDFEGQINALVYMLIEAGIMDKDYNWTYGNGHLFHLGDLFDRGAYVTESLWLFYHLENQAKVAGGDVHFILGNHDMMNFYGDFRYVHERYFENLSLMGKDFFELHSKNTVLGQWLRSKNLMEIAGDTLFVHAGFNLDVIEALENQTLLLEDINTYGRRHLDEGYVRYDDNGSLIKDAYYLPSRLYWDRSVPDGDLTQAELERGLATFGSSQMIIGHTVFDQPSYLYDYHVIAADVDHNQNFNEEGRVQGLEFYYNHYNHFVADKNLGVMRLPVYLTNQGNKLQHIKKLLLYQELSIIAVWIYHFCIHIFFFDYFLVPQIDIFRNQ
ncbi:metallophosphoesterase [Vibrio gallaecicus]|uniref:metallophosphoesterase n=1 Tax=Vibrio gallaecicus TaxID=552386 RepID=UPI0010C9D5DE|nr:metallophosphoesterase [Vibrio gallaecicus]